MVVSMAKNQVSQVRCLQRHLQSSGDVDEGHCVFRGELEFAFFTRSLRSFLPYERCAKDCR